MKRRRLKNLPKRRRLKKQNKTGNRLAPVIVLLPTIRGFLKGLEGKNGAGIYHIGTVKSSLVDY
jgi:hypothetical protein